MNLKCIIPRCIAALAIGASLGSAADMPAGESLMQHYIDRSGGEEAYRSAKNMAMSGTVEMPAQNIKGTVSIFEEGEKSYTVMEFAGIGKVEGGFDGETAWENSVVAGPRVLEGDEKLEAKRAATLSLITAWRDVYKEARTVGSVDIDGKPAWKVEMTAKEGKPETFYFDRDSGMLVRISAVHSTPLGDIAGESTMADFRPVNGILTPFQLTETAVNQSFVMHFSNIAYNVSLPKDRFDLPEGVKALSTRKK